MGGGSGGIIVREDAVHSLSDPTVSGQLPTKMKAAITPILAKDPSTWVTAECVMIAKAFEWALCNLT
jgi:hypothetical protein